MDTAINAPSHCPACGSLLEQVKDELYCRDPSCGAQSLKRLEHFCKTLKIKGFGPATLRKLEVSSIPEFFEAVQEEDDLVERLGCSEPVAKKLYNEIVIAVANTELSSLLASFSIPLIGRSKAVDVAAQVANIWEIDEEACLRAGLGPKATEHLLSWLEDDFQRGGYSTLPFSFQSSSRKSIEKETKGTICISGRLNTFKTKAEAKQALEEKGYIVKDSLTKDVTLLVIESGIESAKTKQARETGVPITENLKEILGD